MLLPQCCIKLTGQSWQIILNNAPNDEIVHRIVAMDNAIAQANDAPQIRHAVCDCLICRIGQFERLAYDFKLSFHCRTQQNIDVIFFEGVSRSKAPNELGLLCVQQPSSRFIVHRCSGEFFLFLHENRHCESFVRSTNPLVAEIGFRVKWQSRNSARHTQVHLVHQIEQ